MAITKTTGWQVVAGGGLQGIYDTLAAAEDAAAYFAPLTGDTYIVEIVRYVYTED